MTTDLDWDTAPDNRSGFTEVKFPGFPLYYLNYVQVPYDLAKRVLWWIDKSGRTEDDTDEIHEKVLVDFACDVNSAKQAAFEALIRLLTPPKFELVT